MEGSMRTAVVIALCALLAAPSHAEDKRLLRGPGTDSCGRYLAARDGTPLGQSKAMKVKGEDYFAYGHVQGAWVQGFLSALSLTHGTTKIDRVDWPGIDGWLRNWCAKNPAEKIYDAVAAFVKEMSEKN
jgi:hypothetical protein